MSSDSGRNLIGWRTESNRAANGNRSGGGRKPIGWRVPSRGCTCLKCTNRATLILLLFCWCSSCSVGAVLALASGKAERRQVHPLKKTLRNRNNIAAGHTVMSSGYTLLYIVPSRLVHLRQVHPLKAPPEFTLRSSCLQRRRCPCRVLRHRCRGSDRRCCRCGCLLSYWLQ